MKIAIPCENGQVFQHFGHTETFKIYTVEANILTMSDTISTNGSGHGALAALLQKSGVTDLICGGIGAGAKQALATANINLYGGVTGDVNVAAQALLAGTLSYDSNITCSHQGNDHDHNEDHECRHGQCS